MYLKNSIYVNILSYIETKYRVSRVFTKRILVLILPTNKSIIIICIGSQFN